VLDVFVHLARDTNFDDEIKETATFITRTLTLRDISFIFAFLDFERFSSLTISAGGGLKRQDGETAAIIAPLVLVSQYNKASGFCKLTAKINSVQLVREPNFADQLQGKNVNFSNFYPFESTAKGAELAKLVAGVVIRVYDLMPTGNGLNESVHWTPKEYDEALDLIAELTKSTQVQAIATAAAAVAAAAIGGGKRKADALSSAHTQASAQLSKLKQSEPENAELLAEIVEQERLGAEGDE